MSKNKQYEDNSKEKSLEIQEIKENNAEEMTLAEAKAYRASLNKTVTPVLNEQEKREAFRIFWAQEKSKYGKSKDLEQVLWLHLKATKQDELEQFENGIKHFGLTKVR